MNAGRAFPLLLVSMLSVAAYAQTDTTSLISVSGRNRTIPASAAKKRSTAKIKAALRYTPSLTPLGSVVTTSPAESFALNGNFAYTCDDNEISIIDITNPAAPRIISTATAAGIVNSGDIHCDIQRNTLVVFSDQTSTKVGNTPEFVAFSLANPSQLSPITGTPASISKRFFQEPVYIGNFAFVPTAAIDYFLGFQWNNQYGDLLAVDLTNFGSPAVVGTLEQPQISNAYGGPTAVFGVTQASGNLLYIGGSTSTGPNNNGIGRLQTVDASVPQSMKLAGQVLIPGTIQFNAPLLQGAVAVGIGNNGGYAPFSTPSLPATLSSRRSTSATPVSPRFFPPPPPRTK